VAFTVDFVSLMERVSIEQVAQMLKLQTKPEGKTLRCACPVHGGDHRALTITPNKLSYKGTRGVFYCQQAKGGGDSIGLAAHMLGCGQHDAAQQIEAQFGTSTGTRTVTSTSSNYQATVPQKEKAGANLPVNPQERLDKIAKALKPDHEAIAHLGLSLETLQYFQAGFKVAGSMPSRLLAALHDFNGVRLGFVGIATNDKQQPYLKFPDNVKISNLIFNAHRIEAGSEVRIVADPLDVMLRYGLGDENTISFLTQTVSAEQNQMLVGLQDAKDLHLIF